MADLSDIRKAVVQKMKNDATLTTLLTASGRIYRGRPRRPSNIPCVTYVDRGSRPDVTVPLWERFFQMAAWHTDLEKAEQIADRMKELFDKQPLTITGGGWRFMGMYATEDEEAPLEDGDVVAQTVSFRLLAYQIG